MTIAREARRTVAMTEAEVETGIIEATEMVATEVVKDAIVKTGIVSNEN